ncbi:efflux RND transporter permease subunit [Thiohalorhabdus sp. Cl-TMA]|uniref:Efflux RND transporter permease subunit n=1 Tax=Thiohalorhabdus methylotrophus TaxID=3242694 RepID=A0ABV4TRX9_9GAMM
MSLPAFSVRRPVFTVMVTLIAVLLGAVSLTRLSVDLMPDVEYPFLTVAVNYPNASPEAMEELVVRPIERAVATVPGLKEITSGASEGVANIRLQFDWGTDLTTATSDVRDALEEEYEDPPEGADRPKIRKFDTADFPIMLVGVASGIDPIALRRIIDNRLMVAIQQVPGVAQVDPWGGPEREVQVRLHPERIQALGLPLEDVVAAIEAANLNRPGGSIERGHTDFTVRVPGRYGNLDALRRTVIAHRGGAPIALEQVAEVRDTQREPTRLIRINGEPGVRLAVRKQSGANTVEVAERLHREIDRLRRHHPQLRFSAIFDQSEYIERSITNATRSMLLGALLAVAVLLFFLRSLRATAVVATAIPVAVITTFGLVYFAGFTLNLMTIGGLALGVGLMVDSAIVVLENIVRRRDSEGLAPREAAVAGASEVAAPVVAGTLTTLAIFLPMFFAEALAGQLFRQLAWVVAFALLAALVSALTLVPMLGGRLLQTDGSQAAGRFLAGLERHYQGLLRGALNRPWTVAGLALAAVAATAAVIPQLGSEFMPATDEGEVRVDVEMPPGTRLETVKRATLAARRVVAERVPEAEVTVTSVGTSGYRPSESAVGDVRISLPPRGERDRSSAEVAADLRAAIGPIPGAQVRVQTRRPFFMRMLSSSEQPLAVEVRGHDFGTLEALAREVRRRLRDIDGLTGVYLSRDSGLPQQLVRVDRERAADRGITIADITETVETAVAGRVASRYLDEGDEVDIRVQFQDNRTLSRQDLLDLRVNGDGGLVRLGSVADLAVGSGPVVIDRKGQSRLITVYANLTDRSMGAVVREVRAALADLPVPDNYQVVIGGDWENQQEAFSSLYLGLGLALLLVYMVMASLYESLRDPLIVMGAVPLAGIGVVAALLLTGTTLNSQSLLGCVILVGIVVNNAILLVDQANRLREEGGEVRAALLEAGRRRLRPILMTTATTILALVPLALGFGEGGETQAPMARAVIGGLFVSTAITLVLIPAIYSLVHRRRKGYAS